MAQYPQTMFIASGIGYFVFYRWTIQELGRTFVIKMELVPETEEVLIQRVGAFGFVKTTRVKIDDLEHYEK